MDVAVAYTSVASARCRPTLIGQCEKPRAVGRQQIQTSTLFAYSYLMANEGLTAAQKNNMIRRTLYGKESFEETATRIAAFINKYSTDRKKVECDKDYPFRILGFGKDISINPESIDSTYSGVSFNGTTTIHQEDAGIQSYAKSLIVGKAFFADDLILKVIIDNIKIL